MLSPSIKTTMHLHEEAHDLYRTGANLRFLDCVNLVNTKQCDIVRMEVWSQMYLQIMMFYTVVTCFTVRTTVFSSPVGKTCDNL